MNRYSELVTGFPAYIGPGAGFAFTGSFVTLAISFLAAAASVLIWPFRMAWIWLRRPRGKVRKLIFLGFDGLDPGITERMMGEGRLPNFARLKAMGVPPPSHHVSRSLACGVVHVRHRRESGQA